jgi:hypothetical protein
MRLDSGEIIPHYMDARDTSQIHSAPGFFDEVALLVGEVTRIIYSSDPDNTTGDTEYIVTVWRRQSDGPLERLAFHCSQSDTFGSIADWFRFSLRPSTLTNNNEALGNGATVLVACINGDRSNAYIIGAIPHPHRPKVDPESGRYSRSRFNGVEMKVNDDGSFELLVPGATDTDGNPDKRDGNNHGSKLTFAANGDITIDDQNGDSIKVSPGEKSISIESSDSLKEKSDAIEVEGDSSWKLKAPKVVVVSPDVSLGQEIIPPTNGVVFGEGIDTFTGLTYFVLQNSSKTVRVAK